MENQDLSLKPPRLCEPNSSVGGAYPVAQSQQDVRAMNPIRTIILTVAVTALGLWAGKSAMAEPAASKVAQSLVPLTTAVAGDFQLVRRGGGGGGFGMRSAGFGGRGFAMRGGGFGSRSVMGFGGSRRFATFGGGPRRFGTFAGPRRFATFGGPRRFVGTRQFTRFGGGFTAQRFAGRRFVDRGFRRGFRGNRVVVIRNRGFNNWWWWGGAGLLGAGLYGWGYPYYGYGYGYDSCYWNCRAYAGPGYCAYNAWRYC